MNNQPIERIDESTTLSVHSIWTTIQGEGPFAGTPATFIRLTGCNLRCPLCDTDYTSQRIETTAKAAADWVAAQRPLRKLVVITGGEPFRQHGLYGLVDALLAFSDITVQIETNGTIYPQHLVESPRVVVVCSPKARIDQKLRSRIDHYKYVLQAGHVLKEDGLPISVLGLDNTVARPGDNFKGIIWVQPADEQDEAKNKENMRVTVQSCLQFGYRLTLQLHKIVGLA